MGVSVERECPISEYDDEYAVLCLAVVISSARIR
jgi:hypothetical protein